MSFGPLCPAKHRALGKAPLLRKMSWMRSTQGALLLANQPSVPTTKLTFEAGERCLSAKAISTPATSWLTTLMHQFPESGAFGQRMQEAELDYLVKSQALSTSLSENYVGLPLNFGE